MKKIFIFATALLAATSLQALNNDPSQATNSQSKTESNTNAGVGEHPNIALGQNSTSLNINDQQIVKDISDKLSSGMFSKGYEKVQASVKNGNVTLTGSVPTQADKDKVEKEVRNIDGVRSLNSQITLRPE